jgi:uncharacterized protein (TIRG00374 family)
MQVSEPTVRVDCCGVIVPLAFSSSDVFLREALPPCARLQTMARAWRAVRQARGAMPYSRRCCAGAVSGNGMARKDLAQRGTWGPATAKMAGTTRLARMRHDVTARKDSQGTGGGPAGGGRPAPVAAKAAAISAEQERPLTWKTAIKRALVVAVAGVAIYLVLPKLAAVLGSWPRLSTLSPIWFSVGVAAELASFTCNFALQRLALRTKGWFAVVTAGLAGNAVTDSLPGGDAAGAAVQFGMLATAGFDTDTAVGGLTAFSLLGVGGLLALPVLALPAMLAGAPVSPGLAHTALLGVAGFVLFAIFGAALLYSDWPLAAVGRAMQGLRNWVTRSRRPAVTGLDTRLLTERDTIRAVLGKKWWQAVLLTTGRLGFDFGCLLAVLRATGTHPRPSLVLLAYAAAAIIALFPLTPGGLGIVEASLSGLLILAGVHPGDAFLATLAYRVASYWLPLLAGPPAYLLFRHRYGTPTPRPADHQGTGADPEPRPGVEGTSA